MIGSDLIGKKVIVRCNRAGVFFGELAQRDGQEVELKNARRLWYWEGAASISQIAAEGVKNPNGCKFAMPVESIVLLETIEIIPCTVEAIDNIEAVKVWKI
jgi:hypothetical protein